MASQFNSFRLRCLLILMVLISFSQWNFLPLQAHEPDKSFLTLSLTNNSLHAEWDIQLRSLQAVPTLGLASNGVITFESLAEKEQLIEAFALSYLEVSLDATPLTWKPKPGSAEVVEYAEGAFVKLRFNADLPSTNALPRILRIKYDLFFSVNSLHRGYLNLDASGMAHSAVFSPEHSEEQFELRHTDAMAEFFSFVREGVQHIASGADHILFLLALLLPAVLQRNCEKWIPVEDFKSAFISTLKIVSAFTLAHSITLSLAALHLVRLPTRLTESAIAFSVLISALNNLRHFLPQRMWLVAFTFGLIHGFGFATALSELGLQTANLYSTLAGFNIGVELGQLAIVALFLPVAFALRKQRFYAPVILHFGSVIILVMASIWLVQRVFY